MKLIKSFLAIALLATSAMAQVGICTNSITTKRGKIEGMNCIGGSNDGNPCTGPTSFNGWTNDCPGGTCGQFVEYGETDDNFDNVGDVCSADLQTWADVSSGMAMTGILEVDSGITHEWTPATWDAVFGNGPEGQIKVGNGTMGQANETIGGTVFDGIFVFGNATDTTNDIAFLWTGANQIPRFVLSEEGADLATYNSRSMVIGPAATVANVDDNIQCSTNFNEIACDTDTTGADLGVENDVELGGTLYIQPPGTAGPNWALFSGSSDPSSLATALRVGAVSGESPCQDPDYWNYPCSDRHPMLYAQQADTRVAGDLSANDFMYGGYFSLKMDAATAQNSFARGAGVYGYHWTPPASTVAIGSLEGAYVTGEHNGSGAFNSIAGFDGYAYNASADGSLVIGGTSIAESYGGTVTRIIGQYVWSGAWAGTITDLISLDIDEPSSTATSITNRYGIRMSDFTSDDNITNDWAIWSDLPAPSYVEGNWRVGTEVSQTNQGYPATLKTSLISNFFNEHTEVDPGRRVGSLFQIRSNPSVDVTGLHQIVAVQGDTYVGTSNTADHDDLIGVTGSVRYAGQGDFDKLFGGEFAAQHRGPGTGNEVRGLLGIADVESGTVSRVIGFENEVKNDGAAVSNLIALEIIEPRATAGTTSNRFAIRLNDKTDDVGVNANNDWAIFSELTQPSLLSGRLILPQADDALIPTLGFGDEDTGWFESIDDTMKASIAGTARWQFTGNVFQSEIANGAALRNVASTTLIPTVLPDKSDLDTGLGAAADDEMSIIVGGVSQVFIKQNDASDDVVTMDALLQLVPIATAPTCGASELGLIYTDTSAALCWCDGTVWEKIGGPGPAACV